MGTVNELLENYAEVVARVEEERREQNERELKEFSKRIDARAEKEHALIKKAFKSMREREQARFDAEMNAEIEQAKKDAEERIRKKYIDNCGETEENKSPWLEGMRELIRGLDSKSSKK